MAHRARLLVSLLAATAARAANVSVLPSSPPCTDASPAEVTAAAAAAKLSHITSCTVLAARGLCSEAMARSICAVSCTSCRPASMSMAQTTTTKDADHGASPPPPPASLATSGKGGDDPAEIDCYIGDGSGYEGTAHTTREGIECQPWKDEQPHAHVFNHLPSNYCRNPRSVANIHERRLDDIHPAGPWCFTSSVLKRWDYCSVPYCGSGPAPPLVESPSLPPSAPPPPPPPTPPVWEPNDLDRACRKKFGPNVIGGCGLRCFAAIPLDESNCLIQIIRLQSEAGGANSCDTIRINEQCTATDEDDCGLDLYYTNTGTCHGKDVYTYLGPPDGARPALSSGAGVAAQNNTGEAVQNRIGEAAETSAGTALQDGPNSYSIDVAAAMLGERRPHSNKCAGGADLVDVGEDDCEASVKAGAAKENPALPVHGLKRGSWSWVPPGCSYSYDSSNALFNTNSEGDNNGNYRLACAPRRAVRLKLLRREHRERRRGKDQGGASSLLFTT